MNIILNFICAANKTSIADSLAVFIMPDRITGFINFKSSLYSPAYIKSLAVASLYGTGTSAGQILYFVFMSAVILGIAYVATKFIARKGTGTGKGKNIKLIEAMPLGFDKSVMLVKVGEQYVLLANTQKNVSFLTNIDSDKLNTTETNDVFCEDNDNSVESYLNNYMDSGLENNYMNSVKDNLKKLKHMVRGNKIDE